MSKLDIFEQQKQALTAKYKKTINDLENQYKNSRRKAQEMYLYNMEQINQNINALKQLKTEIISTPNNNINNNIDNKMFNCRECGKSYKTFKSLNEHKNLHNGTHVSCPVCHKKFATEYLLDRHKGTHNPSFKCDYIGCNKKYSTKYSLDRHKVIHTDNALCCDYCDMKFYDRSHKFNHEKTHQNERPFKCDHCGMGFKFKRGLKRHILRKHTSDDKKPYQCNYKNCNKAYAVLGDLKYHYLRHENIKPYSCDFCDHKSIRKADMTKHIKRVHQTTQ